MAHIVRVHMEAAGGRYYAQYRSSQLEMWGPGGESPRGEAMQVESPPLFAGVFHSLCNLFYGGLAVGTTGGNLQPSGTQI